MRVCHAPQHRLLSGPRRAPKRLQKCDTRTQAKGKKIVHLVACRKCVRRRAIACACLRSVWPPMPTSSTPFWECGRNRKARCGEFRVSGLGLGLVSVGPAKARAIRYVYCRYKRKSILLMRCLTLLSRRVLCCGLARCSVQIPAMSSPQSRTHTHTHVIFTAHAHTPLLCAGSALSCNCARAPCFASQ